MIAVLFAQPNGVYANRSGIDLWPESRDARLYAGPHAVVAHPPCQLWGNFVAINYKRWGGEHNRPGNDGGCFAAALAAVRKFGGVLEHPANSRAWGAHDLVAPFHRGWCHVPHDGCQYYEWVCEVWQSAYGHKARKRTWLLYSGRKPMDLRWDRPDGTHQIGHRDYARPKGANKPVIRGDAASATPPAFADALIALAVNSREQILSLA